MTMAVAADGQSSARASQKPGQISVAGLSIVFDGAGKRLPIIDDISLTVGAGEFVSILGPSGCGKSTLLGAMAGLLRPAAGAVLLDGAEIGGPRSELGVVFQQDSLLPWKTVEQNVGFGLKMRGVPRPQRREASVAMLELVGLAEFARYYPSQLSGGMRQRVEIARVLINRPRVILMDEPFAALDAQARLDMQQLLLDLWARVGVTVIFVTHDIDEAILLADRTVLLTRRPGRIHDIIPIPLARPRTVDSTTTGPFIELKRRCLALIRQEAEPGARRPAALSEREDGTREPATDRCLF